MNHQRIVRTVCFVTVGYVIVLAVWLGWLIEHTPPATIRTRSWDWSPPSARRWDSG